MSRPTLKMTKREKVRTRPWMTVIATISPRYVRSTRAPASISIASKLRPRSRGTIMSSEVAPIRHAMPPT